MSMLRFGNAALVTRIVDPFKWVDKKVPAGRVKVARNIIAKYDPSKWLLSHVSIIASVDVELADQKDKKSNYLIKPEYSAFVNNNGDSWERELLKATYKTFLGADNYVEHVQIPELSKGKVIDVALREVPIGKDIDGKDLTTLYVDILIATNKTHTDLIEKIKDGTYNATSMGCGIAGTKIILPNGSIKFIENVMVGDEVLTHTGKSKKVTALFNKYVSDVSLYSVDYIGAEEPLRLTGEHPILIAFSDSVKCTYQKSRCRVDRNQSMCSWNSKGGKKKIECGRDKNTYEYGFKFVPISEVSKGDYIVRVFPTDTTDSEIFTEDICRLLGIYAGDGYIGWQWATNIDHITQQKTYTKRYPAYIGFCLGLKEKKLQEEVLELLNKISPSVTITSKEVPERNGFYINVYDKDLSKLFYENCGEGAWTKSFSDKVMVLPKDKQLKIISGMFDTDGCYQEKTNSLHYSSASINLLNQLHLLLLRNGIGNARERVLRKDTGKKKGQGKYFQETVTVNKNFSFKVPSCKNKSFGIEPKIKKEDCFFFNNYYLSQIKTITHLRFSGNIYNFSVEEDESYSVDNVAVHNCLIAYSQCSQCGNIAEDEPKLCKHVRYFKNNFFIDKNGVKRIIAELCGRAEDPGSNKFIDASWVKKPAFEGALLRNLVEPSEDISEKLNKAMLFPSFQPQPGMLLRAASQSAAALVNEIQAQNEAAPDPASSPAPKEPKEPAGDDTDFPAAPEGDTPLKLDEPPAEEAPAAEAPVPEAPAAPQPQIQEPAEDATVKEVEDLFTKNILNKIRKKLLKDDAELKTAPGDKPIVSESLNDNFIKTSDSKNHLIKLARTTGNKRLINGFMILSNIENWESLKRYGYDRRDVLGMLHFIDKNMSSNPVGSDAVLALSKIKTANSSPQSFFTEMIIEIGRQPSVKEAKKLIKWAKILSKL
jgi:hypothetical protein